MAISARADEKGIGMTYEENVRAVLETVFSGYKDDPTEIALNSILKLSRTQEAWIKVEDRLPDNRNAVLVTAYWHETYQVMMASYYGDGLWWCVPFNNCGEHMQRLKPKAWMSLPAPYEPQERSDKG